MACASAPVCAGGMGVVARTQNRRRKSKESGGYNSNTARVMLGDWREACEAAGMIRQTFYKVRDSLSECGAIHVDTGGFVYAK